MEEIAGSSEPQAEPEAEEPEKVYGKPREEEPADKVTAAKKKFRYKIPILTLPEFDDTISKLLGTMVSVSFQTMLQASPRLLKGFRQLLTRRRVEIGDNPELPEGEREEEAPQEVANLQRSRGDLEDLEKAFADIRLRLPGREGGEVMRSPPGTKLSFHALPVGKLKVQIRSHHTDALVDGGAKITLIRRDFTTITGCTVNKKVTGSIRGVGGEISFAGRSNRPPSSKDGLLRCGAYSVAIRKPVVRFRKPNKTLRWIQHLQKLNAVTIWDAGSLPQADLLAELHASRSIYSLINLYSGYDQLPLDVRDRPYTAMHTPVGQLQMQVTPMGFTNVVAEAQRRMLVVAGDMFPEKCEPYIDDNPIKGTQAKDETEVQPGSRRFVWDHLQDIKGLLHRFLVYNITASGPKSILAVPEVTILGFRCGVYGKKPDPAKTDKISQWPTPLRTTMEVRAFLGVVDFWRIFIKNFANIVEPIRAMIREEGTMDWTEEREGAVQRLKDILTSETVAMSAPCFNDEVGRPFILETDEGPLAVRGVLIQRDEGGKKRLIRFESRTLNSAERRYSQFQKEVLAILHCAKTFQAYLFGRRFILRIDPTNVAGALKNYRPIDPTVGSWVGFIWQFDYKIERIAGIRNKADGLSRVCITPEGFDDAEPIDAFLEYEGGTLAVGTSGELLIQTLEKRAPAVVAELTEGPVTTRGRREENDSWGPKEELMAMAVEGGREAVMSLVESWERKELQWVVNQMQEGKDGGQEGEEFLYVQSYEGLFRKIGLLLVGNKQPTKVSIKSREEVERKEKMEFGDENDSGAINRPTGGKGAGPSQGRRAAKRKLNIGLIGGPVVGRGGRKCLCRKPSPLREEEGIEISSDSERGKEKAEVEEGGNAEMGNKVQISNEGGVNRGKRYEAWHEESEGGQDMRDEYEEGEERRENPFEGRSGHDSCEGYGTGTEIPFTYDPKNLAGEYSPIQTEDEEDKEKDVREVIEISNGDERDEILRPREEGLPSMHQPDDGAFRWEDEFGPMPSHWFQQWTNVIRHEWIIKTRELARAGVEATPLDFFDEAELRKIVRMRREIETYSLGIRRLDVDKIPMIRIHTVPHEPWNMKGARYPNPDEMKKVVDYLDGKICTHVADYSSGLYASPWFCFIKPNGTLRWVHDLQRLNAVTVRDAGGLPNADALSESCAGRPIISLIDLYSRYDQFPVYPPDRPVTAMHTPRGLIHMNVAPQGWTNAVAMVQRTMIRVMQSVGPHITQPYIDDLAVKGPTVKESDEVSPGVRRFVWKHIQDLDKVLSLLEEHNLTASGAKSRHCMREAIILGFVCSEKGRRPDAKKTDKITEWPVPFHSITDVRSFLGEVVENTPPVDGFLDQEEDVRLHINKWSSRVPSCVGYPIWQAPSGYERRAELDLKLFEEEDPWGGKDVQWMMELALASSHSLVEDMRTIEEGPGQVERHEDLMGGMYLLVNTLSQESLDHSGSLNLAGNVDEVPESQDDEFEEGEIKEAFRAEECDGIYLELGLLLSCEMRLRDASDRAQRMLQRYLVRDGHLFVRREVGNPRRVVCGRNRQIDVVATLHDGIAGRHRGVQATYAKISELYYWDGMMNMVGKFCRSCVPCQERSRLRQGDPLHPRLEREVGAVVHLDLLFMPLGDQSYNYIFDARDNLSGFVDGHAIRTKTGSVLVRCIEEYYLRYPFVREFVMDRGSEFTCQEVQELLSRYGVAANYTTAAHPEANAPVERGHNTITSLLAKWTEGRPNQWPRYLRAAFFVENITVKRSTKYAPATLWYGRHATFPIESLLKTWRCQDLEVNLSFEELLDIRARQIGAIEERIQEASDQVARSRMDDKARWDQSTRVRKVPLAVGDVMLLYDSSLEKQWFRKLDKRWSDFTKTAMPRGRKGTRLPQRPLGASGGYERHGPRHRESTPVYDDGDIKLFQNSFWDHARCMGWTVTQAIERLRGAGKFEEPVAWIRREAKTRSEVEWRMQELQPSPVGPDGRPIRLEVGNTSDFIPAFEWFMQGLVEFHRFVEGGLKRSPACTQEEPPTSEELLRELEAHLYISQWRASPRGEEHGPQTPAVGLRLGDAPGSTRQGGERLQRDEAPLPSSEKASSLEEGAERRRERAAVRREALTLIDRHLASHALEYPDLEELAPAEPRQEPCQPEKEMEAEIPKRVDLRTRERAPAGETAEEKRARRTRRIDEKWQERQRLEAAGEIPEQQQERQRSEAAGALPGQPPSAPARAPEIPEMWRDFWEQRGEEIPSPVRVGLGVARKAEERLDRKINFLAKTTFDRHLLFESDLAGKKIKEAGHGVRLEAMEVEIQELRALVASQAAIIESLRQQTQGRVDKPESSRQGEQRQPGHGLPGQPSVAETRQEPPMGRVILEPEEARAQREEEREAFEFRAPTELATLPIAAHPVIPLAVEEGLPPSSSEPAQGSTKGSMNVLIEAVHSMQEEASLFSPEQRIEEPLEREMGIEAEGVIEGGLQRLGTPEYGPEGIEDRPRPSTQEVETREEPLDMP
ncbi:hypothetical protein CBR_g3630 [Chara braunii]|uniref:Integrase catalytic domain-containing protein n=1 Tax=Chara braunii TaxID=69332 RepID=A0A388KFW4_CHABU|nr:hypothetical protein CBR_g3630 [Chara braunii]|eukprot:GBG68931.1 hypothetical protein CBR_g3630 [Chara braunii]